MTTPQEITMMQGHIKLLATELRRQSKAIPDANMESVWELLRSTIQNHANLELFLLECGTMSDLLPKIAEIIDASIAEALIIFDEAVVLARAQAAARPDSVHCDLIVQVLFEQIGRHLIESGGWTAGGLLDLFVDTALVDDPA
jgi:hypothetical protein